ncbi:uncharacterized protein BJ171DRAFT_507581 [Polychytrium aggregatum]|uniref:uncharacterized protein n=1 Tax=Polychytrium aggregatum TaxID=110093 RepID=UPI0022FECED2|nr:uncharacterized protein BJ171DRAFT_507581 [Polychytrium aggregatum]KAI9204078.1 hypothetical protein BJ171DRAFT_507581 [Polychytrium aggregatum]
MSRSTVRTNSAARASAPASSARRTANPSASNRPPLSSSSSSASLASSSSQGRTHPRAPPKHAKPASPQVPRSILSPSKQSQSVAARSLHSLSNHPRAHESGSGLSESFETDDLEDHQPVVVSSAGPGSPRKPNPTPPRSSSPSHEPLQPGKVPRSPEASLPDNLDDYDAIFKPRPKVVDDRRIIQTPPPSVPAVEASISTVTRTTLPSHYHQDRPQPQPQPLQQQQQSQLAHHRRPDAAAEPISYGSRPHTPQSQHQQDQRYQQPQQVFPFRSRREPLAEQLQQMSSYHHQNSLPSQKQQQQQQVDRTAAQLYFERPSQNYAPQSYQDPSAAWELAHRPATDAAANQRTAPIERSRSPSPQSHSPHAAAGDHRALPGGYVLPAGSPKLPVPELAPTSPRQPEPVSAASARSQSDLPSARATFAHPTRDGSVVLDNAASARPAKLNGISSAADITRGVDTLTLRQDPPKAPPASTLSPTAEESSSSDSSALLQFFRNLESRRKDRNQRDAASSRNEIVRTTETAKEAIELSDRLDQLAQAIPSRRVGSELATKIDSIRLGVNHSIPSPEDPHATSGPILINGLGVSVNSDVRSVRDTSQPSERLLHSTSEMHPIDEEEMEQLNESLVVMARLDSKVDRMQKQVKEMRRYFKALLLEEEAKCYPAVVKIQAVYRGYRTRKLLGPNLYSWMRDPSRPDRVRYMSLESLWTTCEGIRGPPYKIHSTDARALKSCIKIQACYRGHMVRRRVQTYIQGHYAATRIQAAWRGYSVRTFEHPDLPFKIMKGIVNSQHHAIRKLQDQIQAQGDRARLKQHAFEQQLQQQRLEHQRQLQNHISHHAECELRWQSDLDQLRSQVAHLVGIICGGNTPSVTAPKGETAAVNGPGASIESPAVLVDVSAQLPPPSPSPSSSSSAASSRARPPGALPPRSASPRIVISGELGADLELGAAVAAAVAAASAPQIKKAASKPGEFTTQPKRSGTPRS